MIIDCHVHLRRGDPRAERLLATADRLGIDKLVVFGTGWSTGGPGNEDCLDAARAHPDRLIPFAHFRLGRDPADEVTRFHGMGFKGLKLLRPTLPLNADAYMPVYERAERYGMVCLFHLGIIAVHRDDRLFDVDTSRMRPVFLDRVLRRFPELKVIGAHFGNPWYDEAAMLARWHRNLYFDLSGSSLRKREPEFFARLLWWGGEKLYKAPLGRDPWEKMVFGTDVADEWMEETMNDYARLFDGVGLPEDLRRKVMGETAAAILNV